MYSEYRGVCTEMSKKKSKTSTNLAYRNFSFNFLVSNHYLENIVSTLMSLTYGYITIGMLPKDLKHICLKLN